jgi:hypothetical protein
MDINIFGQMVEETAGRVPLFLSLIHPAIVWNFKDLATGGKARQSGKEAAAFRHCISTYILT